MIWEMEIYYNIPPAWVLLLVMIADLIVGDPKVIYDRLPHPVVWMGKLLSLLDTLGNRERFSDSIRWISGVLCLGLYLAVIFAVSYYLNRMIFSIPSPELALLALVLTSSVFLSSRSLISHVRAVERPLAHGNIVEARIEVAMIVGRKTKNMDPHGVTRAAIESLAENFSDGVIAPAFWFLVAGLPGLILYKAINTADSMIGHKNTRYLNFGWAAARLDDVANFIPARLTALLIILSSVFHKGASLKNAALMAMRYAPCHKSPNAGWPEAAVAGAFDLKLGGPIAYGEKHSSATSPTGIWLGEGRKNLTSTDLSHTVTLIVTCILTMSMFLLVYGGMSL